MTGPGPKSGDARTPRAEAPASEASTPQGPGWDKKKRAAGYLVCELCGGPVLDRHCKVVCLNCGFQRDCSDP